MSGSKQRKIERQIGKKKHQRKRLLYGTNESKSTKQKKFNYVYMNLFTLYIYYIQKKKKC